MNLFRPSLLVIAIACVVVGCGGDTNATAPPDTAPAATPTVPGTPSASTPPEPAEPTVSTPNLPGLPASEVALLEGYPGWTELTTPPPADQAALASGAHDGAKRIWAGPAGTNPANPYPLGAVVVKEARTGGDITLIAIMEKVRKSDAANGGWRWAEYKRSDSGSSFAKVSFPESGCAGCHASAKGTDGVFTTP